MSTPIDPDRGPERAPVADLGVLLAIAVGGALGSVGRWAVAEALSHAPGAFAWSTALVNVTGCAALGLLMAAIAGPWRHTRLVRPFLGVGVCGGWTTFSTASLDLHAMLSAGAVPAAAAYAALSVALGVGACARRLPRRPALARARAWAGSAMSAATLGLVVLGGAIGAPLRYLLDAAITARHDTAYPWGTWTINVLGSFVLGVVAAATTQGAPAWVLTLLGTGLCGAFTTFSTFGFETVRLLEQRRGGLAVAYVLASLVVGLLALSAGWALGNSLG